ncbi:N-acetylglutaminylglutamine synthetase [uncultured Ferrovibrio sp.]|jgi:GNAT-family acetyltransferase (TIGR03103 family)|uniref:N-acetylglutaminylglutamine synthetase n=1 Tax=uncultured Ferrovibrio sp. TaxID=1576913 RepID=UPI00260B5D87|nr:N-acetylglutaminylglutamine synthetase [uncultured Ferrovibrio sp.]
MATVAPNREQQAMRDGDTPLSLQQWGAPPRAVRRRAATVDCGWGRLLFGQTFDSPEQVADRLLEETVGERDIAFYVREPHVVLSMAPQALFLDPSHAFRLQLDAELPEDGDRGVVVRQATGDDETEINRLYAARGMVPLREGYCADTHPAVTLLVAETASGETKQILGAVMGVDHVTAFRDPDNGASLWALAVDPQAAQPGIGRTLTVELARHMQKAGRSFLDLSVMHDNEQAISLYRQLGFTQIPVYCVKTRNSINQKLYIGPAPDAHVNIYARIIIDEARRRGIAVDIEDAAAGIFTLTHGARTVSCRESLSDFTTAVTMSRCDDKALTRRLLQRAGLAVPDQIEVRTPEDAVGFLEKYRRIVVKPARGEQGRGVFVDLRRRHEVLVAYETARRLSDMVIAEEFVTGDDLRVIVIDGEVVAAAIRRPATVVGDGVLTVIELIEKQSRRRAAATGGESRIPLDEETERCVRAAGFGFTDILPQGEGLAVRKTANLHTGGTIHDVTEHLHPVIAEAAIKAASVLHIPVVGFDFIVRSPDQPYYRIIEANERPGLANHQPQPTAEKFVDFLFPETKSSWRQVRGSH